MQNLVCAIVTDIAIGYGGRVELIVTTLRVDNVVAGEGVTGSPAAGIGVETPYVSYIPTSREQDLVDLAKAGIKGERVRLSVREGDYALLRIGSRIGLRAVLYTGQVGVSRIRDRTWKRQFA